MYIHSFIYFPILAIIGTIIGLTLYAMLPKCRQQHFNLFFYILFIYYLMAIVSVVFTPLIFRTPLSLDQLSYVVNIIPFGDNQGALIGSQEFSQCIMNAIMFMPLGILMPLTFKRRMKIQDFILICFGFSLTIELIQLLGTYMGIINRSFDINDIIFNTLGGTFTYCFVYFIFECIQKNYHIEKSLSTHEK